MNIPSGFEKRNTITDRYKTNKGRLDKDNSYCFHLNRYSIILWTSHHTKYEYYDKETVYCVLASVYCTYGRLTTTTSVWFDSFLFSRMIMSIMVCHSFMHMVFHSVYYIIYFCKDIENMDSIHTIGTTNVYNLIRVVSITIEYLTYFVHESCIYYNYVMFFLFWYLFPFFFTSTNSCWFILILWCY